MGFQRAIYILLQYLQTFKCGLLLALSRVSDRKGCFYETARFFVAVNPFVANAILGKPLGGYRPLIDAAIFQLKGTVAIVLSWLSAWLLPGKAGKISLDMLEEHIYGDRSKDRKVRYWRRRKLRKALGHLSRKLCLI